MSAIIRATPGSTDHNVILQDHIRKHTGALTQAHQFDGIFFGLIQSLLPNQGYVAVTVPQYSPTVSWNAPYPPTAVQQPDGSLALWPTGSTVKGTLCVVGFISVVQGGFGNGVQAAIPSGLNCVVLAIYPGVPATSVQAAKAATTAAPTTTTTPNAAPSAQDVISQAIKNGTLLKGFLP